jgi:hypothetical protein
VSNYKEPTNEQLASFLAVYAKRFPAFEHISPNPAMLEFLLERRPEFREAGLRHHRQFVEGIDELLRKMHDGELQCEYIRPNGQRCKNHNEPGSYYCGIPSHQAEGE